MVMANYKGLRECNPCMNAFKTNKNSCGMENIVNTFPHIFLLIESSCGRDCGRFCEHMRAGFFWWSYGGRQFIMFNIEFNIQLNILFKFILLNIHIPYIFKIHIVLLLVVIWRSFTLSQSACFFVSCYCFKFTHFLHCSYFNFPLVRF